MLNKANNLSTTFLLGFCLLAISTFSFAEPQTWYFVRHFEKQKALDPSLTEIGKARAQGLAEFFANELLLQVYSTDYQRTVQTATPVASKKGLSIQTYDPSDLVQFAKEIANLDHVLVVGHSNTTPELLLLMGGEKVTMTELDYGNLYILRKKDGLFQTQVKFIPIPK